MRAAASPAPAGEKHSSVGDARVRAVYMGFSAEYYRLNLGWAF